MQNFILIGWIIRELFTFVQIVTMWLFIWMRSWVISFSKLLQLCSKICLWVTVNQINELLYTELSGHGGLGIFRRMDAAVRACERVQVVGGVGGFRRGASVPSRGRGRPSFRGRGGRARDLSDVQCHNCFERGHLRSSCPSSSKGSSKENKW